MYIIETKIKAAFDEYKKDGNLLEFAKEIADVADYSVHSAGNAAIMYDAIRKYCPATLFECIYYDGENGGVYHLFDFDPNGLSQESLRIEIRARLQHELHIEPDYIDKAMESVYLMNTNTLIKMR